jgi:ADP-ribose pyrophosphatase
VTDVERWKINGAHDLGAFGRGSLQRVSVDLPDGTSFDQYIIRLPRAVVVAAVDEGRVLAVRRHRFIIDRWVWELPGGYIDEGEDDAAAAERELLEETGWKAGRIERLVAFQPMVGSADAENIVYAAFDCEQVSTDVDINESGEVRWIDLSEAHEMARSGEMVGAGSVVAIAELAARA